MKKIVLWLVFLLIVSSCVWGKESSEVTDDVLSADVRVEEPITTAGSSDKEEKDEIVDVKEVWIKINVDEIKWRCSGKMWVDELFYTFSSCSWEESTIYVIWDKKYSKDEYERRYEEYSTKWPLCDEDSVDSQGDLRVECKKWRHAIFYKGSDVILYDDYKKSLMQQAFQWAFQEAAKAEEKIVNEMKEWVKNYITFIKEVEKWTFPSVSNDKVGDTCNYSWGALLNGVWVQIVCTGSVIEWLKYVVDDKVVNKSEYLKHQYGVMKEYYDK